MKITNQNNLTTDLNKTSDNIIYMSGESNAFAEYVDFFIQERG